MKQIEGIKTSLDQENKINTEKYIYQDERQIIQNFLHQYSNKKEDTPFSVQLESIYTDLESIQPVFKSDQQVPHHINIKKDASHIIKAPLLFNSVISSLDNNTIRPTYGLPDLIVSNVKVIEINGPNIIYKFTIKNQGTDDVRKIFRTDVFLSTNKDITILDYRIALLSIPEIKADSSLTITELEATLNGIPDGSYYLGIIVDINDDVSESDETNNTGYDNTQKVSVSDVPKPDLTVENVQFIEFTDFEVIYQYTIRNQSDYDVLSYFSNDIYLSLDEMITTYDDYRIHQGYFDGIFANSSDTSKIIRDKVIGIVPDGYYYLGMITDANNKIVESNEDNNTGYDDTQKVPIGRMPKPDLIVENVQFIEFTDFEVVYQYTIRNQSDYDVLSYFFNDIYLSLDEMITTYDDYRIHQGYFDGILANSSVTSKKITDTVIGVPDGDYFLCVITNTDLRIIESNWYNNTGYDDTQKVPIRGALKPNLTVENVQLIEFTGAEVSFEYTIRNASNYNVLNYFDNNIYLSPDTIISSFDDYRIGQGYLSSIYANSSVTLKPILQMVVGMVPDGDYFLGVITDAGYKIIESNEDDNSAYDNTQKLTIGEMIKPDLTAENVQFIEIKGSEILFTYTINNPSNYNVLSSFSNDIYLSPDTIICTFDDYRIDQGYFLRGVDANSSVTATMTTEVAGVPDGDYFLGVLIDANNIIIESNEDNNTGCDDTQQVPISGVPKPDLTVENIQFIEITGSEITFRYTINNPSNYNVLSNIKNDVYLTSDREISTFDDYRIYQEYLNGINATSPVSDTITTEVVGIPDGDYFICMITDSDNKITENNEDNNIGYDHNQKVPINRMPKPDLSVENIKPLKVTGSKVSFKYAIKNRSKYDILSYFYNDIYLSPDTTISTFNDYRIHREYLRGINSLSSYVSNEIYAEVVDVPAGYYYLGIITDANNKILESDETNNITVCDSIIKIGKIIPVQSNVDSTHHIGEEFSVYIKVGSDDCPVVDLFGLSFELLYSPPDYLKILSVIQDSLLGNDLNFQTNYSALGKIIIDIYRKSGQGVNGFGNIVKINMKVKDSTPIGAIVTLSLNDIFAMDHNGEIIAMEGINASFIVASPTKISQLSQLPEKFFVYPNYPNPFNLATKISYDLPIRVKVLIKIFDILGGEVITLVDEFQEQGRYNLFWFGNNIFGKGITSGIYFCQVKAGPFQKIIKMTLIK